MATQRRAFISYRRDDTPWAAAFVAVLFRQRFGDEHVFLDRDRIRAGADYRDVIDDAVKKCDVLVAVIGSRWGDLLRERRSAGVVDLVVREIGTALRRGVLVVPVLVDGAPMPSDLPGELHGLSRYQAVDLKHDSFDAGAARLLAGLESRVPAAAPGPSLAGNETEVSERVKQFDDEGPPADSASVERPPRPLKTVGDADGLAALLRSKGLVVVQFRSDRDPRDSWRSLEMLLTEQANRTVAVRVDLERLPDVARDHRVERTPTIVVFRQGSEVARIVGVRSEADLRHDLVEFLG